MRSLLLVCAAALLLGGMSGCHSACQSCHRRSDICANGQCGCANGQCQSGQCQGGCPGGQCQCANGQCQGGCEHPPHIAAAARKQRKQPAPGAYRHAGFEDECQAGACGPGGPGGAGGHGLCHGKDYRDGPPSGPQSATVAYPYYTLRGPRDFLLNNPPTIGP